MFLAEQARCLGGNPLRFAVRERFAAFFRRLFLLPGVRLKQQGTHRLQTALGGLLAADQIVLRAVAHAVLTGGEQEGANTVCVVDHGLTATEIFGHEYADPARIGFVLAVVERQGAAVGGENGRLAAAESVNALLDVPDHKALFAADIGENPILYRVDVLIFVDENRVVAVGERAGIGGG